MHALRFFTRILVCVALLAGLHATSQVAAGPNPTQPFNAVGVVDDADAPIAGGAGEGANASFVLKPVTAGSDSALEHLGDDGSLQIYTTTATSFLYKEPGHNKYEQSTYDEVVVEGAEVRAAGRRVKGDDGVERFVARAVFNPPNNPSGNAKSTPECTTDTAKLLNGNTQVAKSGNYNLKATVSGRSVKAPCTGFGGFEGFKIVDFQEPSRFRVEQGLEAYDYELHVYTTFLTRYVAGDEASTKGKVLRVGNEVRVLGRFAYVNGGYVFVARTVFTPAPARPDTFNPRTDVEATEVSPGHYEGVSNGPSFAFGEFVTDIVWTPTADGYTATGTWRLSNGQQVLRGTLDGDVEGTDLELNLDVTSGEGQWWNASGSGSMEGDVTPGVPGANPTALSGRIRLSVITS